MLGRIAGFIQKLAQIQDADKDNISKEEIRIMVSAVAESGKIDENEIEMIHNIFEFNDKTVEEIVTHRKDIVALSASAKKEEILQKAVDEKYSRFPVYEDSIDNIIGILHIKDLLKYIIKENGDIPLRSIVRKPYFVPLSKKTDELFGELQKLKQHMAIVVDEYGGIIGLVTMEDLIEEIMGSILDEYDEEETPDIQTMDDNTFVINGTTSLDAVSDFLEVPLPTDDYDTLSGFIIGQLGRIPTGNEQPEIEFNGLLFKVYKAEGKRISYAVVCRLS